MPKVPYAVTETGTHIKGAGLLPWLQILRPQNWVFFALSNFLAEKTFVKQSMMLEWENVLKNYDLRGGVNCTDTKSYRHQIGLQLGGGGKSDRHQIVQTPNQTMIYPPPPQLPSLIWCLYNLVSVWFSPPQIIVWFDVSTIWCLYGHVRKTFLQWG